MNKKQLRRITKEQNKIISQASKRARVQNPLTKHFIVGTKQKISTSQLFSMWNIGKKL